MDVLKAAIRLSYVALVIRLLFAAAIAYAAYHFLHKYW